MSICNITSFNAKKMGRLFNILSVEVNVYKLVFKKNKFQNSISHIRYFVLDIYHLYVKNSYIVISFLVHYNKITV